jgi:hypothetical protein
MNVTIDQLPAPAVACRCCFRFPCSRPVNIAKAEEFLPR